MTNEELLNEYEFTVAFYVIAIHDKNVKAMEEYENHLRKLKIEILKRME